MNANIKIVIIAAISKNGVIGKHSKLPWVLKSDLKRFASITKGNAVLMGKRTRTSIGKLLPKRTNIVITSDSRYHPEGYLIAHSLEEAMAFCEEGQTLFVIGGTEVYKTALPYADKLLLTEVDVHIEYGSAFFPDWNRDEWEEVQCESVPKSDVDQYAYTFRELKRKATFCNTNNARTPEQLEVMKKINTSGYCPFCRENLQKNHKKPILFEGKYWLVTENQWPYKAALRHFLIISTTHAEKLSDLPKGAGDEFIHICQLLEEKYDIKSGAACMRFGNMVSNGATVDHLHAHLLEPDPEKEDPLIFWVDKKRPPST